MSAMLIRLAYGFPSLAGERLANVSALTGSDELRLAQSVDAGSESWLDVAVASVACVDERPVSVNDVAALTLGDRNSLLLALLSTSFGARLSWVVDCQNCRERLDVDIAISDLLAGLPAVTSDVPTDVFRLPTVADLHAIVGLEPEPARDVLLALCVPSAAELDDDTIAAIEEAMSGADPLADIELSFVCGECRAPITAAVDLAAELRARLTSEDMLLQDVHAFALAYGWTEPDVLALARPRRREYLTLIADLTS